MATEDYDYRSGRTKILERAFRIVGALPLGKTLSGEKLQQGNQVLNDLIQSWTTQNIFLWELKVLTFSTVANTVRYSLSLDPRVLDVEAAYVVQGSDELKLTMLDWRQYTDIQSKSDTGRPLIFSVEPLEAIACNIFPKPDAVYVIKYLARCKLRDYDETAQPASFPVRFERAAVYGVAADLADEYGLDPGERTILQAKGEDAFKKAKNSDKGYSDDFIVTGSFSTTKGY